MSERQPKSFSEPFRLLAGVQILLDSQINDEADLQVLAGTDLHAQPDRAFRTIHVMGTKGKGSVSRMLAVHLRVTGERLPLAPCHVAEPDLANMVAGGQE